MPVGTGTGISHRNLYEEVKVFPNPTSGKIYLEIPDGSNPVSIKVINNLNELKHQAQLSGERNNMVELELGDLANGIYYLHINSEEINGLKKIIVSR